MDVAAISEDDGDTANSKIRPGDPPERPEIVPDLPELSVNSILDSQQVSVTTALSDIYENILVEVPCSMPDCDPNAGGPDTRDGPTTQRSDNLSGIQDEEMRRRTG